MDYTLKESHYIEGKIGRFVRHPLYCGLAWDKFPMPMKGTKEIKEAKFVTMEEMIALKLQHMPDKEKDFEAWVFYHDRPYRLHAMLEGNFDGKLAASVYIDSEFPDGRTWKNIFKMFEPTELMDGDNLKTYNELPEEFNVYQGYTGDKYEISWTLSKDVADWFSKRFNGSGRVRKARIKKSQAVAYFGNRNEEEIIYFSKPWGN